MQRERLSDAQSAESYWADSDLSGSEKVDQTHSVGTEALDGCDLEVGRWLVSVEERR